MSLAPPVDPQETLQRKERYYRRNFISLMLESFFFAFALALFSPENVLPVYVASYSDRAILIALISALHYGLSYSCTVVSSVIGVAAKSPKWISVIICFLQRVGFFLIYLSTYMASGSKELALVMFFVSLSLYAGSAGMSSPLFAQMVGTSIHRNVGTFYGAYSMVGSASGVLASVVLARSLATLPFPLNFRQVFLFGLLSSLVATVVVAVGVKEVTDDRVREQIRFREIFSIGRQILRDNRNFRNYTMIKVLVGAAEFAIPYYILVANGLEGVPPGFVGILSMVYLIAKMMGAMVMGRIGDRFGPMMILRCSCLCGAAAALLAILSRDYRVSMVMYALLAVAVVGVMMSNSVACITYSGNQRTPVYAATVGLLGAPLYVLSSFGGAAIATRFSHTAMFLVALGVYLLSAALTYRLKETGPRGKQ